MLAATRSIPMRVNDIDNAMSDKRAIHDNVLNTPIIQRLPTDSPRNAAFAVYSHTHSIYYSVCFVQPHVTITQWLREVDNAQEDNRVLYKTIFLPQNWFLNVVSMAQETRTYMYKSGTCWTWHIQSLVSQQVECTEAVWSGGNWLTLHNHQWLLNHHYILLVRPHSCRPVSGAGVTRPASCT